MASHHLPPARRVVSESGADAVVEGGFKNDKDDGRDLPAATDGIITIQQDESVKRDAGW